MRVCAVVLAAGSSRRFGQDKTGLLLGNKPVWRRSFDAFLTQPRIEAVGLVGSEANLETLREKAPEALFVVLGGQSRQESSLRGVSAVPSHFDVVLVHDAARPFVTAETIDRVLAAIERTGAAAAAIPVVDTLRRLDTETPVLLDRSKIVGMQTPQGAQRAMLLRTLEAAAQEYTDEMEVLAAAGLPFEIVEGDPRAFKLTTPADWERARGMIEPVETRTGLGYDIHSFSTDPLRPMMLGGIRFEGVGLEGHSDADVVIHAVVDALLGAAALGDIGQHFPNTDPRWHNAPSSHFLSHAVGLLQELGWQIVNVDISVLAERPKVMPKALEVRQTLAGVLGIEADRVSFKATTNERLGAIGRGEGIAAFAVATIRR